MKLASGKRVVKEAGSDEERRRELLVAAVRDVIRFKAEEKTAQEGLAAAKAKVEELSGLTADCDDRERLIQFPGMATVRRIWATRKSIKRERLVEYLMTKLGATGAQANQTADAVTDTTETSYIDVRAEKK